MATNTATTTRTEDAFVTTIANAVMVAAADIIQARGLTVDLDALVVAMRAEAKAVVLTVLDDGKALVDSGRAGWLDALVRTECTAAARRAVGSVS